MSQKKQKPDLTRKYKQIIAAPWKGSDRGLTSTIHALGTDGRVYVLRSGAGFVDLEADMLLRTCGTAAPNLGSSSTPDSGDRDPF